MPEQTPGWQDGYREAIDDVERLIKVWVGCARLDARKRGISGEEWDAAVQEESANALDRLRRAIKFMGEFPKRNVNFDDETTDVRPLMD